MKKRVFALVVIAVSLPCLAAQPDTRVVIGQPSVFWHNGEWQTYKEGVWTPYGQAERGHSFGLGNKANSHVVSLRPAIARTTRREGSLNRRNETNPGIGQPTIGIGQPNGIGQSTGGLGQPNVAIGQTTIGIGQPNVGMGQPNGIGQTTIGIGKPTVAIGGNNTGIGRPNVGLGQPNGTGQTTIGIGKPMIFPPQPRSSPTDTTIR
jgi:hypothetical protein